MDQQLVIYKIIFRTSGGSKVFWTIKGHPLVSQFPFVFKLYSSKNNNDWTLVNTVTNSFFGVDPNSYSLGAFPFLWYKVELYLNNSLKLTSEPANISDVGVSKRRKRIATELTRKFKVLGRMAGRKGIIYHRKRFGNPCPVDSDPLGKLPQRALCPTCFGTGIEGGYFFYPDELCYFIQLKPQESAEPVAEVGRVAINKVAGILYSPIDFFPNDLWRDIDTDEIFEIDQIQTPSYGGSEPEAHIVSLTLKPRGHIIYKLPTLPAN